MKFPQFRMQIKNIMIALLAGVALLVLTLLSTSLGNLELEPARQFFSPEESQGPFVEWTRPLEVLGEMSPGEAVLLFGGLLLVFILFLLMLSPEARKRIIKALFRFAVTVWVIYFALTRIRPRGEMLLETPGSTLEQVEEILDTPPPFVPPDIPAALLYAVSLVVVLSLVGIGFLLYRILSPPRPPFRTVAHAARKALKDLAAGHGWEDTVISCYAQMSAAVSEHRGLFRHSAMTPAEFARRLEEAGLPSGPVSRLTRLFEAARYSTHTSSPEDVNEAVACLSSILHAVGERE